MRIEADIVLIGTGLAPLLVAVESLTAGKRVAIMNPDSDFFAENSELPFPLLQTTDPAPWLSCSVAEAYRVLSPFFPGAIELWSPHRSALEQGYYDPEAPHLRGRNFLLLKEFPEHREVADLDRLGSHLRKRGVPAKAHEGIAALRRFPGFSGSGVESAHAISIPQIYDLDIDRYRQGILELVWDRLGEENFFMEANSLHFDQNELRFYSQGKLKTLHFEEHAIVFWTPKIARMVSFLTSFNQNLPFAAAKQISLEQWDLVSREPIDPTVIGVYEGAFVWANFSGAPDGARVVGDLYTMSAVLGADRQSSDPASIDSQFLRESSFKQASRLWQEFLNWDKYSVRSIRPRAIFDWEPASRGIFPVDSNPEKLWIATGCDGAVLDVAKCAKQVLEAMR